MKREKLDALMEEKSILIVTVEDEDRKLFDNERVRLREINHILDRTRNKVILFGKRAMKKYNKSKHRK